MDPTARLIKLLALLQVEPRSGEHLAARLGVTTRTVRRDVQRLRDLGYHVDAAPGVEGGYRLAAGQALPPLVLDDDEAVAVAVGLRAAANGGVRGLEEAAATALSKLEQSLPSRLRARVQALQATESTDPDREGTVDAERLSVLALAARRGERLLITYRDAAGRQTRRDVDPYRIVRAGRRWYLVAHDVRKQQWRTFRVDRVQDVLPTAARVEFTDPPDARQLVREGVAVRAWDHEVRVRVMLPFDEASYRVPGTAAILEADGDHTLLRMGVDNLDWAAAYLVGLDVPFEVVAPPALTLSLRTLGRRLAQHGRP